MKIDEAAARLEALGNPTRLKIYRMLVRAGDPGLAGRQAAEPAVDPGVHALASPEDADHRRARHPGARCDDAHLPGQLSGDARPGRVPGGGMLHGSRLRLDPAASRHRCLDRFACNFDVTGRMDTMSNPAEDSRHHRRRPGRPCRGSARSRAAACKPVVLEAGDKVGHAVRQWSHVRMFSPWSYNVDKASERLVARGRLEQPGPGSVSDRRRARRALSRAARDAAPGSSEHIQTNARVISVARVGFDKVKTAGRENAPFEIRYQNGKGPSTLRADAVIDASGTWGTPNPAGVNGLEAIGEAAQRQAHRLWHARCPRRTARPLCGQDRRRARRRPFGRRHHSRSGAARRRPSRQPRSSGFCAATIRRSPLAAAPMTSWPRAANSARSSPSLSAPAAFASKPASG